MQRERGIRAVVLMITKAAGNVIGGASTFVAFCNVVRDGARGRGRFGNEAVPFVAGTILGLFSPTCESLVLNYTVSHQCVAIRSSPRLRMLVCFRCRGGGKSVNDFDH